MVRIATLNSKEIFRISRGEESDWVHGGLERLSWHLRMEFGHLLVHDLNPSTAGGLVGEDSVVFPTSMTGGRATYSDETTALDHLNRLIGIYIMEISERGMGQPYFALTNSQGYSRVVSLFQSKGFILEEI